MASIYDGNESAVPKNWIEVPSYYVDGALGSSHARGVQRVLLGSVTFNPEIMATEPTFKPVVELIMTPDAIRDLIEYLSGLPGVSDDGA